MKTVLITGASGFIGSYVREEMRKEQYRVVALSRKPLSTESYDNEIWIHGDLSDPVLLGDLLSSYSIDVCVHLAWDGIPDYSFAVSWQNLQNGINVLKLCSNLNIGHLIVSGSCWEYKEPEGCIDENWPADDSNHFKAAKNSLRIISHAFCKERGITLNWLRLFYVYGSGQREGALIPYIKKELSEGRIPQLNGAYNKNDFIHAKDVAKAFSEVIKKKPEEEILNVGSGETTRVLDILYRMAGAAGIEIPEDMYPAQPEVIGFYADISRLSRVCEWEPMHDL